VNEYKRSFKFGKSGKPDLIEKIDEIMNEAKKSGGKDSSVNMYRKISLAISKKGAVHAHKSLKGGGNV
jgi:hypothetical protein